MLDHQKRWRRKHQLPGDDHNQSPRKGISCLQLLCDIHLSCVFIPIRCNCCCKIREYRNPSTAYVCLWRHIHHRHMCELHSFLRCTNQDWELCWKESINMYLSLLCNPLLLGLHPSHSFLVDDNGQRKTQSVLSYQTHETLERFQDLRRPSLDGQN